MSPRPSKKTAAAAAPRSSPRAGAKKRAAGPRPKKAATEPSQPLAPLRGAYPGLRAVLALLCVIPVLWGAWKAVRVKVGQHVTLERMAPILPQGDKPGTLSFVHAIKADGKGGIVTLSVQGAFWRIQHFDDHLLLSAYIDLDPKKVGNLTDLAVLPDGSVRLSVLDGSLVGLDARLRLSKPAWRTQTGLGQLRSLDALADGRLLAMDSPDRLKCAFKSRLLELRVTPLMPSLAQLRNTPGILGVSLRGGKARIYAAEPEALLAQWRKDWPFAEIQYLGHDWAEADMEDVFKAYSQNYHEILGPQEFQSATP